MKERLESSANRPPLRRARRPRQKHLPRFSAAWSRWAVCTLRSAAKGEVFSSIAVPEPYRNDKPEETPLNVWADSACRGSFRQIWQLSCCMRCILNAKNPLGDRFGPYNNTILTFYRLTGVTRAGWPEGIPALPLPYVIKTPLMRNYIPLDHSGRGDFLCMNCLNGSTFLSRDTQSGVPQNLVVRAMIANPVRRFGQF